MFKTGSKVMVLGSAVGLPYVFSNSVALRDKLYDSFGRPSAEVAQAAPPATPAVPAPPAWPAGPNPLVGDAGPHAIPPVAPWAAEQRPAHLEPVELRPLADVLRFDVTTAWVMANWSRVSTALSDIQLQGYRVALITGTGDGDLAGSLTYYFNPLQKVQRIVFQGTTGDARPLVQHLTTHYKFERQVTADPREFLFEVRYHGRPVSQLRMRPAPIVRQDDSRTRFEVSLYLERPEE